MITNVAGDVHTSQGKASANADAHAKRHWNESDVCVRVLSLIEICEFCNRFVLVFAI